MSGVLSVYEWFYLELMLLDKDAAEDNAPSGSNSHDNEGLKKSCSERKEIEMSCSAD